MVWGKLLVRKMVKIFGEKIMFKGNIFLIRKL